MEAATTMAISGDTSIEDTDLQLVTVGQLQAIVNQLTDNNRLLEKRVNKIRTVKIKLLLVERFTREKLKLKGFLA